MTGGDDAVSDRGRGWEGAGHCADGIRVGVDVGGTFTDLVALVEGRLITAKALSTPSDQTHGVIHAIEGASLDPGGVVAFAHGSTVATNALLERSGARTALITTEGFRDVIEIGRQNRPSLYDLTRRWLPPLVPRELRFTVRERMGPAGVLVPLDETSVAEAVEACRRAQVEAVAVCLLFGYLHPQHEHRVGEMLRKALPGMHISLSSEVLPEFREYERCSTTVADAYLTPKLATYLHGLGAAVKQRGFPALLIMQSSGGVVEVEVAGTHSGSCILSGPAGGVVGAAYVAGLSGYFDLLTFDMGGTSTDVAAVLAGRVATTTESVIAGVPIKLPTVDVHSVSAGGGSIAWMDEGGALRVGPRSAGADPGPACYGRRGEDPTATDANLFLGYLHDTAELGGEIRLDRDRAEAALSRLGKRLGLDLHETALGVVRVADAEMIRALRVISIERGLDPRELALVAFGGAGGMHACSLAEELGMTHVLVPKASGVLSAFGLAISDLRRDYVQPFLAALDTVDPTALEAAWRELEARARAELTQPALTLRRLADLRYRGQSFELTVAADNPDGLTAAFHAEHERRYGYRREVETVELVNIRLVATVPVTKPFLHEASAVRECQPSHRQVSFDGRWEVVEVVERGSLGAGSKVEGPMIVEFSESTCVVRPGWRGTVDEVGTLVLERTR